MKGQPKSFRLKSCSMTSRRHFTKKTSFRISKKKGRAVNPASQLISKVLMFIKRRLRHHESSPVLATSPVNPASPI